MKIISHTKSSYTNLDRITRTVHRLFLFGIQFAVWRTAHRSRPSDWNPKVGNLFQRFFALALLLCFFVVSQGTARATLVTLFGNSPVVKASSSTNTALVQVGTITLSGAKLFVSNSGTLIPTNITVIPMLTLDPTGTNFLLLPQQFHPAQSISTNNENVVITNYTLPVYGAARIINTTNADVSVGIQADVPSPAVTSP